MGEQDRHLELLLEESKDTHADAMRGARNDLEEFVELGLERRGREGTDPDEAREFALGRNEQLRRGLSGAGVAAGIGAAIVALSATAAFGASATDVQILQTQESIENLAVATYGVALGLSFIGGSSANGVIKAFATETRKQHQDHAAAFAAAIKRLGGKTQSSPDPVLLKVVDKAKPTLTTPAAVVALALELEDGAAQTYVANTAAFSNANARSVTASIMGVEAQHAAILRAVQALLGANDSSLIALPPSPLSSLPSAAGSVGFPNAFYPTSQARPKTEGAVR